MSPTTDPTSSPPAHAHLTIALSTPTPRIPLSQPSDAPDALQLILTARIASATPPARPITFLSNGSVLDNGNHSRHGSLFHGSFPLLRSVDNPARKIVLASGMKVNYGRYPDGTSENLREQAWNRFETIWPRGEGTHDGRGATESENEASGDEEGVNGLTINQSLSLDRIFQYSGPTKGYGGLTQADVRPGEKFSVCMNKKMLRGNGGWWAFGSMDEGGELYGKKFIMLEKGVGGENEQDDRAAERERRERDGWVYSEMMDDLKITAEEGRDEVVVEFVE